MNERDIVQLSEAVNRFNQADAIHEGIATANRKMLLAYMKEGFSREEAMKLLESNPIKIYKD